MQISHEDLKKKTSYHVTFKLLRLFLKREHTFKFQSKVLQLKNIRLCKISALINIIKIFTKYLLIWKNEPIKFIISWMLFLKDNIKKRNTSKGSEGIYLKNAHLLYQRSKKKNTDVTPNFSSFIFTLNVTGELLNRKIYWRGLDWSL